jgi:hypothetical protein
MSCNKKKYTNKYQAKKAAKYYEKIDGYKSKAYWCTECNKAHLT